MLWTPSAVPREFTTVNHCDDAYRYIYTSYATLSSGIPWNIPRGTCIFWYTHEPLGSCVYQENTSDGWDIPWLYPEKVLHNYFIPCHGTYRGQQGQHNQCEIRADLNGFEIAS